MKRTFAASAALVVSALLLAGCNSTTPMAIGSDEPAVINLTSTTDVVSLCGESAEEMLAFVNEASDAEPTSGKRNALKDYGIDDPATADLTEIIAALKVRANTDCENVVVTGTEDGNVGVENGDGTVMNLPLVSGSDTVLVMDSTTQPATPPLLDGSLRFTAQTLSWAGLVERVGNQQWYIDGVNARAAQTGFTWDDVLRFASANSIVDGKIQGVNALAIQVFNQPDLTDEQARDMVREYITPAEEAVIGITVDNLPIQRINNGFINTRNVGAADAPQMGDYFDTQAMVRVTLMPITFDEAGNPTSLDGSRGSGVFIDCGNLHWVPVAVWKCTDASCFKPKCPPGMIGTPPNCEFPPPPPPPSGCKENCGSDKKNWALSPSNGWTPIDKGPLTDGKESQRQQESGETRGNVIDDPVPAGTGSGDTTPDLAPGSVTAPGATTGGDNRSDDVVDETVTNQDDGGTNGDTCIADPDTGVSNCG